MSGRRRTILAVLGLAVLGPVVPALAAPQPGSPDATFVQTIHQGNLTEIAAGQDAEKNGQDSCVKEVAAIIVRDHTKLDEQLSDLAKKGNVVLADAPSATQQAGLDKVKVLAGTAGYDKAWLGTQEQSHEGALALIDKQIKEGKDADTVQAALKARPVVAMHLDMVRGGSCHVM
ncbi:DUF4142 domain-containing protein [Streptomyces sp. NPDC089919]|uniref:DUF4142 domain-containing protein n=1 Tax=Streptomyces sp. NPDC089919 TaxID=3155188 RepID=UPI0034219656